MSTKVRGNVYRAYSGEIGALIFFVSCGIMFSFMERIDVLLSNLAFSLSEIASDAGSAELSKGFFDLAFAIDDSIIGPSIVVLSFVLAFFLTRKL